VEQLVSLEELDVAYNCISSGEALSALSSLTHLIKLSLEFNPISYVKDYRQVVLRRVSSGINRKKFRLDEQPLNSLDKDALGTMAALYSIQLVEFNIQKPISILSIEHRVLPGHKNER